MKKVNNMALVKLRSRFDEQKTITFKAELEQFLGDILPFSIDEYKIVSINGTVRQFKAVLECNITDSKEFVTSYAAKSDFKEDYS